ncbi:MAG: DNA polymerase III subunit delta [Lachnospiraceae bacterium]|nr:DNA polymerase III subunit delta [Lachnospiraceae bacterium]
MTAFRDIIGQEQAKGHVRSVLATGRMTHAALITGETGMGKKMFAKTWAQAILCEDRQMVFGFPEPCGKCRSCVMAEAGTHPEIRILTHEKAGYGVGEIRDQLVNDAALKPMISDYRIYIIPEAEKLNIPCQNALLKTLEEPPSYVVIMLLASNAGTLLPTILSRVIELPMRPVSDEDIVQLLMKEEKVADYHARECAALAEGNVGRAIRYAGDADFRSRPERVIRLLSDINDTATPDIMEAVRDILIPRGDDDSPAKKKRNLKDAGTDELLSFLAILRTVVRDIMVYKAGAPEKLVFKKHEEYYEKSAAMTWPQLFEKTALIDEAEDYLSSNVNTELAIEMLMLGMRTNQ